MKHLFILLFLSIIEVSYQNFVKEHYLQKRSVNIENFVTDKQDMFQPVQKRDHLRLFSDTFILHLRVTFLKNGTKSHPKFTSENLKNKRLEDKCLAGIHF